MLKGKKKKNINNESQGAQTRGMRRNNFQTLDQLDGHKVNATIKENQIIITWSQKLGPPLKQIAPAKRRGCFKLSLLSGAECSLTADQENLRNTDASQPEVQALLPTENDACLNY